jgi:hypothetical protein
MRLVCKKCGNVILDTETKERNYETFLEVWIDDSEKEEWTITNLGTYFLCSRCHEKVTRDSVSIYR